ncbi:MAG: hypothetical protein HY761_06860 [Candidatus Omnitrophica bacterium]|nr:hypothetical protein [Candidatus Omnitrophota bacterium]
MKTRDKVFISFNPHHLCNEKLIGTVKGYHPRAGVGGCDLVDVEYVYPRDGQTYNMLFGRHNLEETSANGLLVMADHYEAMAKYFRELAVKVEKQ